MDAYASSGSGLTRRDVLKGGAVGLTAVGLPGRAWAQTPKRGGTLSLRLWDPPHCDPYLTISYKTHIAYSFTHSRLSGTRPGPGVAPGTFPIEGDLAESWTQPNETTYVFKLRSGVRWHPKPPVNGRELAAEDVKYSVERFLTDQGQRQRLHAAGGRQGRGAGQVHGAVHAQGALRLVPRHARQPDAPWPSSPASAVEKFGDLKKAESASAPGPWMLDSYRPNVGLTFVGNPSYFLPGLPYIDRIEVTVDEDNASRMAAFVAGKYDLGWEFPGARSTASTGCRSRTAQAAAARAADGRVRLERDEPHLDARPTSRRWSDVRVRRAISLAVDRQGILDATAEGVGVMNPRVPAALKDWALPIDQLGEGARYYKYEPARGQEAPRRGRPPERLPGDHRASRPTARPSSWTPSQLLLKYLKDVGIDVEVRNSLRPLRQWGGSPSCALPPANRLRRNRLLPLRGFAPACPRSPSRFPATRQDAD